MPDFRVSRAADCGGLGYILGYPVQGSLRPARGGWGADAGLPGVCGPCAGGALNAVLNAGSATLLKRKTKVPLCVTHFTESRVGSRHCRAYELQGCSQQTKGLGQ